MSVSRRMSSIIKYIGVYDLKYKITWGGGSSELKDGTELRQFREDCIKSSSLRKCKPI